MKKFLVSMMLVLIAGASVMAQNPVVNNPNNKPYFGVRIGGEVTCPGKILTYDTYASL